MSLLRVRKTGPLANGRERGGGTLAHLLDVDALKELDFRQALCGTAPGPLTGGWELATHAAPSCSRCARRAHTGRRP